MANLSVAFGITVIAVAVAVINYPVIRQNPGGASLAALAVVWLAGALGMFFGSRLAWCGSMLGIGTLLAFPLIVICNTVILIPTSQSRIDVFENGLMLAIGQVGVAVWVLIFIDHLHLGRALMRREHVSGKIKPKTVAFLVASGLIFGAVASSVSALTSSLVEDKASLWREVWMMVHLPALLAYIGTLAEHDPWKGKGGFIFVGLQWCLVGILLGLCVSLLHSVIRKLRPWKRGQRIPPLLGTLAH